MRDLLPRSFIQITSPVAVHGLGILSPRTREPRVICAGDSLRLGGADNVESESWRRQIRASSGVARARSGTNVPPSAAVLGRALLESGGGESKRTRIGVSVASASATTETAYRFETVGVFQKWSLVDPFGLPNAIPSIAATQVALALGARAFAVTFVGGSFAFYQALIFSALAIQRRRADHALVIGADEFSVVQEKAAKGLERVAPNGLDSTSGMFLSGGESFPDRWTLGTLGSGAGEFDTALLPAVWTDAITLRVASISTFPFLDASSPTASIAELLAGRKGPCLFVWSNEDEGVWWAAGFRRGCDR